MAKPFILVVDDDADLGDEVVGHLKLAGIAAQWVGSGAEALELMTQRYVGLVISDVKMPQMDGIELLTRIKAAWPDIQVVMMSGGSTLERAVTAMKKGASDFIEKPFDPDDVVAVVRKELERLTRQSVSRETVPSRDGICMGTSAAMKAFDERLTAAAKSPATVVLRGENGVGKELAAHAIHNRSSRKDGPFVVFQATALPDGLLYSELFGSSKGSHSTALGHKPGRVELAEKGTLFLDEVGDLNAEAQLTLLRLIENREYQPLGEGRMRSADVRFVAATNRDLDALVASGKFRQDLFQRLNVIPIPIPALRDRKEDVRPLALHFLCEHAKANGRPNATLTDDAIALLEAEAWPGNVRQLQNFIERLVVMSEGDRIDDGIVRRELGVSSAPPAISSAAAPADASLPEKRNAAEAAAIRDALRRTSLNCTRAAKLLGIGRRTLYNKMDELGIDPRNP